MAKSVPRPESLLAALPAELSHSLFAKARPVSLAASQTLFVAGDEGDGCYRIEEGLLKASIAAATGGERILAILGPGSVVGELSMIDGGPRSASGPIKKAPPSPRNSNSPPDAMRYGIVCAMYRS